MGADEKHTATYHGGEYTSTTEAIRDQFIDRRGEPGNESWNEGAALRFDRWLETVRAEAKAEALNEVADEWERLVKIGKQMHAETTRKDRVAFDDWAGQEKPGWLRARANQYKEEQ